MTRDQIIAALHKGPLIHNDHPMCPRCRKAFKQRRHRSAVFCHQCSIYALSLLASTVEELTEQLALTTSKVAGARLEGSYDADPGRRYLALVPILGTGQQQGDVHWTVARSRQLTEGLFGSEATARKAADAFVSNSGPGRVLEIVFDQLRDTNLSPEQAHHFAERMLFFYTEEERRRRAALTTDEPAPTEPAQSPDAMAALTLCGPEYDPGSRSERSQICRRCRRRNGQPYQSDERVQLGESTDVRDNRVSPPAAWVTFFQGSAFCWDCAKLVLTALAQHASAVRPLIEASIAYAVNLQAMSFRQMPPIDVSPLFDAVNAYTAYVKQGGWGER